MIARALWAGTPMIAQGSAAMIALRALAAAGTDTPNG